MDTEVAQNLLGSVLEVMRRLEPRDYCDGVERELRDEGVEAFLKSNTVWGGAGSIADQVGVAQGRKERRKVEALLVELGEFQISENLCNQRTEMWVDVFKQWEKDGI